MQESGDQIHYIKVNTQKKPDDEDWKPFLTGVSYNEQRMLKQNLYYTTLGDGYRVDKTYGTRGPVP